MTALSLPSLHPLFQASDVQALIFSADRVSEEAASLGTELEAQGLKCLFLADLGLDETQRTGFWRGDGLNRLAAALRVNRDELVVVTDRPQEREELLGLGLRACLCPQAEGGDALWLSLQTYLTGEIYDPIHYLGTVVRLQSELFRRQFAATLDKTGPQIKAYAAVASELTGFKTGFLEPYLRALFVHGLFWNSQEGEASLAGCIAALPDPPPVPRFLSADRVRREALDFVGRLLTIVETGTAPEARQGIDRLLTELEGLSRLQDSFLRQADVIRPIGEAVRRHIRDHHFHYVQRTGVLHEEEWKTLVEVFQEDDLNLDRRYTGWVDETYQVERDMVAEDHPLDAIRDYVKERLLDDLILRVMELEMRERALQQGVSRVILFPTHHDARNRVTALTVGIENRKNWKAAMTVQATTVSRWVQSLSARLAPYAKKRHVALKWEHVADPGLPPRELVDMTENEREALDHIVTEWIFNAIKYRRRLPGYRPEVVLAMTELESEIRIEVRDNGIGIQDTSKVWEPDVREHPEEAEGYGGGLPSVRARAGERAWTVEVDSKPGAGTVFRLIIPAKRSTQPPASDSEGS